MTIFGPSLGTLWRTLESYGLDPRLVIDESDYTPGHEGRAHFRLSFGEYDRLRAQAAELIGDPAVGLRSADHIHPSHFGALGYSWMASSTLLDGFRRIVRFLGLALRDAFAQRELARKRDLLLRAHLEEGELRLAEALLPVLVVVADTE